MGYDQDCYDDEYEAGINDGMDEDEAMDNALIY